MAEKGLRLVSIETEEGETATEEPKPDLVELGQWYWVKDEEELRLACVTHLGSNYFQLSAPNKYGSSSWRIHLDKIGWQTERRELNPEVVINGKIEEHRHNVSVLLDEIKLLSSKLGLTPAGSLTDGSQSTALVAAHEAKDVKAHKNALIKAKEETLPDLFKKVEEEHEAMARWMEATLLPLKAEVGVLQSSTESIEDRIFTVELYAGLCEEVECIRKGEPASNDEKVHLFQRRHYMDEECLVEYSAGGMEFKDLRAFDRWLMKKGNRERLLPMPKCVVAFQVRRNSKQRDDARNLHEFIKMMYLEEADRLTFLYIRNGDRYYRLSTSIDFGSQLFPDEEKSSLFHGQLYVNDFGKHEVISEKEYRNLQKDRAQDKKEYREKLVEWNKLSKKEKKEKWAPTHYEPHDKYETLTPESVYYDDGMAQVTDAARQHNRIAVVLQGLLDRSPVFHPHPPWRLWTPEGFASGVELVYDDARAITSGDAPDFEIYRTVLNLTLVIGSHTIGQQDAWERAEAVKENRRRDNDWRDRRDYRHTHFRPYGNDGPGNIAKVAQLSRDGKSCGFKWDRERIRMKRWEYSSPTIPSRFKCSTSKLLNVSAYTPGDYKQFYADPRTRANYLKWAPLLLAAEDHYAKGRNS